MVIYSCQFTSLCDVDFLVRSNSDAKALLYGATNLWPGFVRTIVFEYSFWPVFTCSKSNNTRSGPCSVQRRRKKRRLVVEVESLASSSKKNTTRRREDVGSVVEKNIKSRRTFNKKFLRFIYSNNVRWNSVSIFDYFL